MPDVHSSDDHGLIDPVSRLEVIACDGCRRCFETADGPGMLTSLRGPCPDCGGRFELLDDAVGPGEL